MKLGSGQVESARYAEEPLMKVDTWDLDLLVPAALGCARQAIELPPCFSRDHARHARELRGGLVGANASSRARGRRPRAGATLPPRRPLSLVGASLPPMKTSGPASTST